MQAKIKHAHSFYLGIDDFERALSCKFDCAYGDLVEGNIFILVGLIAVKYVSPNSKSDFMK